MGVVLVAGATGGVKRVVQQMVERSYQVRALVRDADKAREILGDDGISRRRSQSQISTLKGFVSTPAQSS